MDYNHPIHPPEKYSCPRCNSGEIVFLVYRLDFGKLLQINSGTALLSEVFDPQKSDIWQCKKCFDIGRAVFDA